MGRWTPNWTWLTATLAVGGSFPTARAEALAKQHRIAAVVDLRAEACDDPRELTRHGVKLLHLPTEDHCAVSQPMLDQGVSFAREHLTVGRRLLIHCEHGIGRSATLALCVLVDLGLEPLDALAFAKDRRPLVCPSPPQYEAWAEWLRRRDPAAKVPDFDAFKAIAYRHLQTPAA